MSREALTSVRLIGRPAVLDDEGNERAVRGHQAWAVLARLLLTERPVTRRELATELFAEAENPMAALRWCLAEVRKALRQPQLFLGDPPAVAFPDSVTVDVLELRAGRFDVADAGELLADIDPRCGAEFETWLLVQRQRVASLVDELIRREVLDALARQAHTHALERAELLARRKPYDEGAQVLLVKALAASGDHDGAVALVHRVEVRFEAELGNRPSAALRSAARSTVASAPIGVSAHAIVRSLCESGLAAISAGATDAGLDCLRRATHDAEGLGDTALRARCLLELGTSLMHAVRGHDDEAAVLLYEAAQLAEVIGDPVIGAAARRELGCIDALVGRRLTAAAHIARGIEVAGSDSDLLAGLRAVSAFNLGDWGRTAESRDEYDHALDLARRAGNCRREAWILGLGGWMHATSGDLSTGRRWVNECLTQVDELRWLAFRPWPIAVLAEIDLQTGRPVSADELEHNFAASCHLADPCWEGMAAKNLAVARAAAGDPAAALRWIDEARVRCLRASDTYVAITAAVYRTEAEIASGAGDPQRAHEAARNLIALAARTHMDDHLAKGIRLAEL